MPTKTEQIKIVFILPDPEISLWSKVRWIYSQWSICRSDSFFWHQRSRINRTTSGPDVLQLVLDRDSPCRGDRGQVRDKSPETTNQLETICSHRTSSVWTEQKSIIHIWHEKKNCFHIIGGLSQYLLVFSIHFHLILQKLLRKKKIKCVIST